MRKKQIKINDAYNDLFILNVYIRDGVKWFVELRFTLRLCMICWMISTFGAQTEF